MDFTNTLTLITSVPEFSADWAGIGFALGVVFFEAGGGAIELEFELELKGVSLSLSYSFQSSFRELIMSKGFCGCCRIEVEFAAAAAILRRAV